MRSWPTTAERIAIATGEHPLMRALFATDVRAMPWMKHTWYPQCPTTPRPRRVSQSRRVRLAWDAGIHAGPRELSHQPAPNTRDARARRTPLNASGGM